MIVRLLIVVFLYRVLMQDGIQGHCTDIHSCKASVKFLSVSKKSQRSVMKTLDELSVSVV